MTLNESAGDHGAGVLAPRCYRCGWQAEHRPDDAAGRTAAKADVAAHKAACAAAPSPPEPLECNAMGVEHAAHVWDFGSGEDFACPGWSDDGGCTDECPEDCEADHQGEE